MMLVDEALELEAIAKAFRTISKEISYRGLAKALLEAALEYSGAARGAVLLSQGGELLARADASFPREKATVFASHPPADELRLRQELSERMLARQGTVVERDSSAACSPERDLVCDRPGWNQPGRKSPDETFLSPSRPEHSHADFGPVSLCLQLTHHERTIGVLYLEFAREHAPLTHRCVSAMSMLASQAAVSFESAQLFDALRETSMWMVKGQQIGRMGSYRWNTRTLLSRGSRECYRILGLDLNINPVPFQAFRDRIHPDDLPALERALAEALSTQSPFRHEYRVVHEDGTTLYVVAVGQFDLGPSGDLELDGIITDITERKAAEQALTDAQAELARAASLASLGELAGSIIHEVNQPMTGIIASAEACLRWLTRGPAELDEVRKSVMRIVEQGHRASNVVSGLRSLVRDGQLRFADVQINDAVEEVLLIVKRELERAGVALRTAFDTSLPDIEADKVQLQQVALNLVRNAIEAMLEVGERARVLTISSKVVNGDVSVTIADTGVGIDPAIGERLFDALYTTKHGGLGLGLSICRKIISAHGGRLWAEQNTSDGATFTFAVPIRRSVQCPRKIDRSRGVQRREGIPAAA